MPEIEVVQVFSDILLPRPPKTNVNEENVIKSHFFILSEYFVYVKLYYILSINEKLPLTRVHLTQEHIWIFLDRELPSVELSFLWCTVL